MILSYMQDLMPTYAPLSELSRRRIDIIRGFLCFYVFCFHYYVAGIQPLAHHPPIFDIFLNNGSIAVDIFFALSGFLISHSVAKRLSTHGRIHVFAYLTKRLFRTIPA